MFKYTIKRNKNAQCIKSLPYYIIFTCLTITTFLFLFSLHVSGQEAKRHQLEEAAIKVAETECKSMLREQLNQQGYENAGITITHVSDEDGVTEYQIEIHHKKLNKLSEEASTVLLQELSAQYQSLLDEDLRISIQ